MSHFIGLCFGDWWESNIDAYDENLRLDVGTIAYTKEEAIKEVIHHHKLNYEAALLNLEKESSDESRKKYFQEIVDKGPVLTYEQAWEDVKTWGYDIDENENLITYYNPDSKWDWYCIGGRWDGFLYLKETDSEGNRVGVNSAYMDEIDWDYMFEQNKYPFCYVTEEGDWIERGNMGWWGCVSNEKDLDIWESEFKNYVKSLNPEDNLLVTVVDFHI